MNLIIYSLCKANDYDFKEKIFGHIIYSIDKKVIIVPETFSENSINPSNYFKIQNKLSFDSINIIDRVKPTTQSFCIMDHINKAGFNFLIGATPLNDFPVFPDMSKIYNPIKGLKQVVVHTVGPKRFNLATVSNNIISESVGLIAPVWHYVGINVFAKNNYNE